MELKYKNKLVSNWGEITNYVFKVLCPVLKSEAYDESRYKYCKSFSYHGIDMSGDAFFEVECNQNEVSISAGTNRVVVETIYHDNACVGTFVKNGSDGRAELSDYNFNTGDWVYNDQTYKTKQAEHLETLLYLLLRDVEYQWHNIRDDINYYQLKRHDAIMNFSIH